MASQGYPGLQDAALAVPPSPRPTAAGQGPSPARMHSMKDLEQKNRELEKEIFSLKLRIFHMEEQLDGQGYGDLGRLNVELKLEITNLRKQLEEHQSLLMRARASIDTIDAANQHKVAELQSQYERTIAQLRQRIADLERESGATIARYRASQEELERRITALQAQLQAAEESGASHKELKDRHKQELDKLHRLLDNANGTCRQQENEIARLARQVDQQEAKLREAQRALNSEKGAMGDAVAAARAQVADAQDREAAAVDRAREAQMQQQALQSDLQQREQQVQDLTARLAAASPGVPGARPPPASGPSQEAQDQLQRERQQLEQARRELELIRTRLQEDAKARPPSGSAIEVHQLREQLQRHQADLRALQGQHAQEKAQYQEQIRQLQASAGAGGRAPQHPGIEDYDPYRVAAPQTDAAAFREAQKRAEVAAAQAANMAQRLEAAILERNHLQAEVADKTALLREAAWKVIDLEGQDRAQEVGLTADLAQLQRLLHDARAESDALHKALADKADECDALRSRLGLLEEMHHSRLTPPSEPETEQLPLPSALLKDHIQLEPIPVRPVAAHAAIDTAMVDRLQDDLDRLRSKYGRAKGQIAAQNQELLNMRDALQHNDFVHDQPQELSGSNDADDMLLEALKDKDEEVMRLRQDLANAEEQFASDRNSDQRSLRFKLAQQREQIARLESDLASAKLHVNRLREEKGRLAAGGDMAARAAELQIELQDAQAECALLRDKVARLAQGDRERDDLLAQLSSRAGSGDQDLQGIINDLTERLAQADQRLLLAEEEMQDYAGNKAKMEDLEGELDSCHEALARHKAEAAKGGGLKEDMLRSKEQMLTKALRANDELSQTVAEMAGKISALETQLRRAKATEEDLQRISKERLALMSDLAALEEELRREQDKVGELRGQVLVVEEELRAARLQTAGLESELLNSASSVEQLHVENARLQSRLLQVTDELEGTRAQLSAELAERNTLDEVQASKLARHADDMSDLQRQLAEAFARETEANAKLGGLEAEMESMKRQLRDVLDKESIERDLQGEKEGAYERDIAHLRDHNEGLRTELRTFEDRALLAEQERDSAAMERGALQRELERLKLQHQDDLELVRAGRQRDDDVRRILEDQVEELLTQIQRLGIEKSEMRSFVDKAEMQRKMAEERERMLRERGPSSAPRRARSFKREPLFPPAEQTEGLADENERLRAALRDITDRNRQERKARERERRDKERYSDELARTLDLLRETHDILDSDSEDSRRRSRSRRDLEACTKAGKVCCGSCPCGCQSNKPSSSHRSSKSTSKRSCKAKSKRKSSASCSS